MMNRTALHALLCCFIALLATITDPVSAEEDDALYSSAPHLYYSVSRIEAFDPVTYWTEQAGGARRIRIAGAPLLLDLSLDLPHSVAAALSDYPWKPGEEERARATGVYPDPRMRARVPSEVLFGIECRLEDAEGRIRTFFPFHQELSGRSDRTGLTPGRPLIFPPPPDRSLSQGEYSVYIAAQVTQDLAEGPVALTCTLPWKGRRLDYATRTYEFSRPTTPLMRMYEHMAWVNYYCERDLDAAFRHALGAAMENAELPVAYRRAAFYARFYGYYDLAYRLYRKYVTTLKENIRLGRYGYRPPPDVPSWDIQKLLVETTGAKDMAEVEERWNRVLKRIGNPRAQGYRMTGAIQRLQNLNAEYPLIYEPIRSEDPWLGTYRLKELLDRIPSWSGIGNDE